MHVRHSPKRSKALDGQRRERLEKIHIIGSASRVEEPLLKLIIRKKLARAVLPPHVR
jgi:hypothetical protein